MTKQDSCAVARPTSDRPKCAQSTWACSAGKACSRKKGFARLWAQAGHDAPQLHDAAGIAAVANHLVDARGAQPRMLLQGSGGRMQ